MLLRIIFNRKTRLTFLVVLFSSSSSLLFANELKLTPKIKTTGYMYQSKTGTEESKTNQAISIEPSILTTFTSKRFSSSLAVNHTSVKKGSNGDDEDNIDSVDSEDSEDDNSYTELQYNANLTLVENFMNLSFNGSQNYRIVSQEQNYFADKILDSGQLTKSQRHSATFSFTTPNPKYLGIDFQTTYSKTDTEESLLNLAGIDGANLSSFLRLSQGNHADRYSFDISAQYNDTSRELLQDFSSTSIQGTIGVAVTNKAQVIVVGSSNDYDVDLSQSTTQRTNLDTTSYGIGVQWSPMNERIIKLTYNELDEQDNKTKYVGLNIDWALSSRTAIKADYSKKFYGDAYSLDFDYKLKAFRSSIQYNEEVTTFSQLSNTSDTGIFVCELGSVDLLTCFQPDSINYILQAGEEFRNITQFDTDISEEVLFRKSGSIDFGYDKGKLKTSLNVSYSKTEYIESNRIQTSKSIFLDLVYILSKKTKFTFSTKRALRTFAGTLTGDTVITTTLGLNRDFGRNLNLSIDTKLLDRDRDADVDTDISDVSDKRLTLSAIYTF